MKYLLELGGGLITLGFASLYIPNEVTLATFLVGLGILAISEGVALTRNSEVQNG